MSEEKREDTVPEPLESAGLNAAVPEETPESTGEVEVAALSAEPETSVADPTDVTAEAAAEPDQAPDATAPAAGDEPAATPDEPILLAPTSAAPDWTGAGAAASGDDTLLAAVTWLSMVVFQLPILSVVLLLIEPNRSRPFQRYHAVTSIAFWCVALIYEGVAGLAVGMLTLVTLGVFAICMACLWVIFIVPHVVALVYAFQAFTGKTPEIPVITKLARDQHWI
jgi:uncharacterized membrane protein